MPNYKDNGRTVLFISERVAMWQSHWQPRRIPLSHKDLRCVKYFANPGKVGKELDGERTRTVRCQPVGVRKCPNSIGGRRGAIRKSFFRLRFGPGGRGCKPLFGKWNDLHLLSYSGSSLCDGKPCCSR